MRRWIELERVAIPARLSFDDRDDELTGRERVLNVVCDVGL